MKVAIKSVEMSEKECKNFVDNLFEDYYKVFSVVCSDNFFTIIDNEKGEKFELTYSDIPSLLERIYEVDKRTFYEFMLAMDVEESKGFYYVDNIYRINACCAICYGELVYG